MKNLLKPEKSVYTILLYILAFILLLSCSSVNKQHETDGSIFINNTDAQDYYVNEIFANVKLLELSGFVGTVDDIAAADGGWAIIDKTLQTISFFDTRGRLQHSVSGDLLNTGKAIQPVCVATTPSGQLLIYDAANQKLLTFSYSLQLLGHAEAPFYMHKIYPLKNGFVVFKNQMVQNNEASEFRYDIIITDASFRPLKKLRPFHIELNVARIWLHFDNPVNLYYNHSRLSFCSPLADSVWIYDISRDTTYSKKISFARNGLQAHHLQGLDINDPQVVINNIFNKYCTISSRLLQSDLFTGIRYISNMRQYYYLQCNDPAKEYNIKKLLYKVKGEDLVIPFPYELSGKGGTIILDTSSYEELNLAESEMAHPLIEDILFGGKTYLMLLEK